MKEPTKADLATAVARLTGENAGLRDLLAAVSAYADMPHPAEYTHPSYVIECERRLDAIAIYANGDQDGMDPGAYMLVLGDRAKELRERAARPVRYESRPVAADVTRDEPASPPHHVADGERACQAADNESAGYICTAQDGHSGPDHIAYIPGGGEYHRWAAACGLPAGHAEPAKAESDEAAAVSA